MRNVVKDYLRRQSIHGKYKVSSYNFAEEVYENQGMEDAYSVEHTIKDKRGHRCNIMNEQLYNAIHCLSDKQKEILILEFWYDVRQTDIAKQFNVSERTIYNWKQKAFKRIQKFYDGEQRMGNKLLDYNTMYAAVHGDRSAQAELLEHYDSYINSLSTMTTEEDRQGNIVYYIDEDLKAEIQLGLLEALPKCRAMQ